MKRTFIAVSILVVVGMFCSAELIFLKRLIGNYTSDIENIKTLVEEEKMDEAVDQTDQIIKSWKSNHGVVSTFIDHEPLEEIQTSFNMMKVTLEEEETADFAVECEKALIQLEYLNTTEMPLLGNIL